MARREVLCRPFSNLICALPVGSMHKLLELSLMWLSHLRLGLGLEPVKLIGSKDRLVVKLGQWQGRKFELPMYVEGAT